jgi:hypothetical protein
MNNEIVQEVPGERFRYWVRSRSRPEERHLVDLLANGGNGECACEHFTMTCKPNWRHLAHALGEDFRSIPFGTNATICWHIVEARSHAFWDILRSLSSMEGEGL